MVYPVEDVPKKKGSVAYTPCQLCYRRVPSNSSSSPTRSLNSAPCELEWGMWNLWGRVNQKGYRSACLLVDEPLGYPDP